MANSLYPRLFKVGECLFASWVGIFTLAAFTPSLLAQEAEGEAKPWDPHHTKGREKELAKEILALPDGDVKWLALSGLVQRWIDSDAEAVWEFGNRLMEGFNHRS